MRRVVPYNRLGIVLALIVTANCGGGTGGDTLPPGTPVILVSIDTLRSDRLPAYGYSAVATPNLDEFAADAVVFERVYSQCPLTLPSHASLFTALLPPDHGVRTNREAVLTEDRRTLAEQLRDAGYRTGGVVSSMVLRRQTGIAQGFEDYDDRMEGGASGGGNAFTQRRGDRSLERAGAWLDGLDAGDRFFLFLHLFDTHTPYEAPEPFASRYDDPYDAEIAYVDSLIGDLLARLKRLELYDRSLIVILSDHGEGLGDHGESEHGLLLYREALQVPLFFKLPGGRFAGRREASAAALIDVAPTVLGRLGLDTQGLAGHDLFGSPGAPADRTIYSETLFTKYQYGWSELRSVIRSDMHYIEAPRPELFDLGTDFEERHNLHPRREIPVAMLEAIQDAGTGVEATAAISPEELEQLAALGYAGGLARGDPQTETLPDPKDYIEAAEELWKQVKNVHATGSLDGADRVLQRMEELGIRNEWLSSSIAATLMQAGHSGPALEILRPFAGSADPGTRVMFGCIRYALGDADAAMEQFREALRLSPGYARAHYNVGTLLERAGSDAAAAEHYRAALQSEPRLLPALLRLAHTERRLGEWEPAVGHYGQVVELDPLNAEARLGQAMARVRLGRFRDAARDLEEAGRVLPEQPAYNHALARLLVASPDDTLRDGDRAMQLLQPLVERQRNTDMAETLAMALAELGQFERAAEFERSAIEFARAAGRDDLVRSMQENLSAYESGRPWRIPWRDDDPIHVPERNAEPSPPDLGRAF